MFRVSIHPLEFAGIGFTVALLTLAWAGRGRLNAFGLEFLAWRKTSTRESAEALIFGSVCGLAVALLFQSLYKGAPFKWQDAWIGITLGPLMEEAIFRGYLFGMAEWGLRKRVPQARWIAGTRSPPYSRSVTFRRLVSLASRSASSSRWVSTRG
jgi:membrane protease YdiL (CAAX protease family)